jgi:hypothetical protein
VNLRRRRGRARVLEAQLDAQPLDLGEGDAQNFGRRARAPQIVGAALPGGAAASRRRADCGLGTLWKGTGHW